MDKQTVKDALDRLRAQGDQYIQTDDVAEILDEDISRGERGYIGRLINRLSEDGEPVEEWSESRGNKRWRLTGGGGA